jgi:arabinose-5-phosphate isomerase
MLSRGEDISKLHAQDIMNHTPKTILADTMAVKALEVLQQHSIMQLIVVDEGNNYLGIIHLHDLIREGII